MSKPSDYKEISCAQCVNGEALGFDFSMAFQPIVDVKQEKIFAHEALARGLNNEPAGSVFKHVNDSNLYRFDQTCRIKAVQLAAELGLTERLSINFMPNAIYRPELCIRATLEACDNYNVSVEKLIFEITEGEQVTDHDHLKNIVTDYQQRGFLTAIDDFGAGYSGLNMLAEIQTDVLKIDMALVRGINADSVRQALVKAVVQFCTDLNMQVIAEGIETRAELHTLRDIGIDLYQGYYIAKPAFQKLIPIEDCILD